MSDKKKKAKSRGKKKPSFPQASVCKQETEREEGKGNSSHAEVEEEEKRKRREELRKKLREKMSGGRGGENKVDNLASRLRDDPASFLLQMGVEDADILSNAGKILKDKNFIQRCMEVGGEELEETEAEEEEEELPACFRGKESEEVSSPPEEGGLPCGRRRMVNGHKASALPP